MSNELHTGGGVVCVFVFALATVKKKAYKNTEPQMWFCVWLKKKKNERARPLKKKQHDVVGRQVL